MGVCMHISIYISLPPIYIYIYDIIKDKCVYKVI